MFKEVLLCGAKQKGTNWIYGVPQSGMFFFLYLQSNHYIMFVGSCGAESK